MCQRTEKGDAANEAISHGRLIDTIIIVSMVGRLIIIKNVISINWNCD